MDTTSSIAVSSKAKLGSFEKWLESNDNRNLKRVLDFSEIKFTAVVRGAKPVSFKRTRKYQTKINNNQSKKGFIKQKAYEMRVHRTFSEARFWREIYRYQLLGLKFISQVPVGDFICDFVCPDLKLVIELDGSQHRTDPAVVSQDRRKTEYLTQQGYDIIRFDNEKINHHLNQTMAELWHICSAKLLDSHNDKYLAKTKELIHLGNPYLNKIEQFRLYELVEITGIPKSTIQYYRRKGLLYSETEQRDRSKIPSHLIQYYTLEHVEKLRHIHSFRTIEEMPTRMIYYTLKATEEAKTQAQSPEQLTPEQTAQWIEKVDQKFYIPPKKRVVLKYIVDVDGKQVPQDYPSAKRPRRHVFAENNPYSNTIIGDSQKLALTQTYTQALKNILIQQREHNLSTQRSFSPLGVATERMLQATYERRHLLLASYLTLF
jgi:very-short-patch-repair endonuclease/DNA-binding transcriptional MerR regulator